LAPENVTFAPKDISPIDFTPKVGVQGLGYRGLDPSRALGDGPGARGHINLFRLDSDPTSSLLGGPRPVQKHRGGVAGQVGRWRVESEGSRVRYSTTPGVRV